MMCSPPGIIERAYQLAQTSENVEQVRLQLRREGYSNVDAHLAGPKIRSDLIKIIRRPAEPAEVAPSPT
jgi:hypothetical protein